MPPLGPQRPGEEAKPRPGVQGGRCFPAPSPAPPARIPPVINFTQRRRGAEAFAKRLPSYWLNSPDMTRAPYLKLWVHRCSPGSSGRNRDFQAPAQLTAHACVWLLRQCASYNTALPLKPLETVLIQALGHKRGPGTTSKWRSVI